MGSRSTNAAHRIRAAVVIAIALTATSACQTAPSQPVPTVTVTQTAPPATTPAASPSPAALASPGRLPAGDLTSGRYRADCLPGSPVVRFRHGRAVVDGWQVGARVVAEGHLNHYPVYAVAVKCYGADASPDVVTLMAATSQGVIPVGFVISPRDNMNLYQAGFTHGRLYVEAYGYSRNTPQCCPDLAYTRWYTLQGLHMRKVKQEVAPLTQ